MRKTISVRIEFFDFAKSGIKHLKLKNDKRSYWGMAYSFEQKQKNFWEAKIRVNSAIDFFDQIEVFIHECVHIMMYFFTDFGLLSYFKRDFQFKIIRDHKFVFSIGEFAFKLFKKRWKKKIMKEINKMEKIRNSKEVK